MDSPGEESSGTAECADGAFLHCWVQSLTERAKTGRKFTQKLIFWGIGDTGSLILLWIPEEVLLTDGTGWVWPFPDISPEFKLILAFQNKKIPTPTFLSHELALLTLSQDGCGTQCSGLTDQINKKIDLMVLEVFSNL